MRLKKKLTDNILDKVSIDFLRNQVLKNAYGNDDTVIAGMDPRMLLVWYLFFGLVPWFVDDIPFLLGCFCLVALTTKLARVAGMVLFLFVLGVFSRRCLRHRAAVGPDAEGGHRVPRVGHYFFRPGSG